MSFNTSMMMNGRQQFSRQTQSVLSSDPIGQVEHLTGKTVVDVEFIRYGWLPGLGFSEEHYNFIIN